MEEFAGFLRRRIQGMDKKRIFAQNSARNRKSYRCSKRFDTIAKPVISCQQGFLYATSLPLPQTRQFIHTIAIILRLKAGTLAAKSEAFARILEISLASTA